MRRPSMMAFLLLRLNYEPRQLLPAAACSPDRSRLLGSWLILNSSWLLKRCCFPAATSGPSSPNSSWSIRQLSITSSYRFLGQLRPSAAAFSSVTNPCHSRSLTREVGDWRSGRLQRREMRCLSSQWPRPCVELRFHTILRGRPTVISDVQSPEAPIYTLLPAVFRLAEAV